MEHPARGSPLGANKTGRPTRLAGLDSGVDAAATKSPTGRSPKVERRTTMTAEREVPKCRESLLSFHLEIEIGFSGLSCSSTPVLLLFLCMQISPSLFSHLEKEIFERLSRVRYKHLRDGGYMFLNATGVFSHFAWIWQYLYLSMLILSRLAVAGYWSVSLLM